MTEARPSGHSDLVDEVTVETLRELTALADPCVTLLMPTHRDNPDLRHDALQLRTLADEAADRLTQRGEDADQILAQVRELVDDTDFWRRQGDGLAVYADAETTHVFRVPRPLDALAHVGAAPRLLPLARIATGDEEFHLLALGQNSVRLFRGSRDSLAELDLGPIPSSIEDTERDSEREPELQHRPQPSARGVATFHGHGGADVSDQAVQTFLQEVAEGTRNRLGADDPRPLVLAAVSEHLPVLQSTGRLPMLLDEAVTGNPENLRPQELLERAWPIVRTRIVERREELADRFGAGHGAGTAVSDQGELHRAAQEGRIDTVLVPPSVVQDDRPDDADDQAVVQALTTGAQLAVTDLPDGIPLAALLRY